MDNPKEPNRTALYDSHLALGGRMVPFAGWEMPVRYKSILDEVRSVRTNAGIFDVSHMGRIEITGEKSTDLLDRILSFDVGKLRIGRAKYNVICSEDGGIIDDCIVYRTEKQHYLLVPNSSNKLAVLNWINNWNTASVRAEIHDVTDSYGMIAIQGPRAIEIVSRFTKYDLSSLKPFAFAEIKFNDVKMLAARTGYTGEDGLELLPPQELTPDVWSNLLVEGADACGLGARDVLRLEAGLLLHGNDMNTEVNPYEAGLDRFVSPDRPNYVPGKALRMARDTGVEKRLVGIKMIGRGIARQGYPILENDRKVGIVTSGSPSPTLDMNIAMGYVPNGLLGVGTQLHITVRDKPVEAEVVSLPFYSRRRTA